VLIGLLEENKSELYDLWFFYKGKNKIIEARRVDYMLNGILSINNGNLICDRVKNLNNSIGEIVQLNINNLEEDILIEYNMQKETVRLFNEKQVFLVKKSYLSKRIQSEIYKVKRNKVFPLLSADDDIENIRHLKENLFMITMRKSLYTAFYLADFSGDNVYLGKSILSIKYPNVVSYIGNLSGDSMLFCVVNPVSYISTLLVIKDNKVEVQSKIPYIIMRDSITINNNKLSFFMHDISNLYKADYNIEEDLFYKIEIVENRKYYLDLETLREGDITVYLAKPKYKDWNGKIIIDFYGAPREEAPDRFLYCFDFFYTYLVKKGYMVAKVFLSADGINPIHVSKSLYYNRHLVAEEALKAIHIIKSKYKNSKIILCGVSNGGYTVASVLNKITDLVNGAILVIPNVNLLYEYHNNKVMLLNNILPEDENYIRSINPKDNIKRKHYPDILIIAAKYDTRVLYEGVLEYYNEIKKMSLNKNIFMYELKAPHEIHKIIEENAKEKALIECFIEQI
jgi:predicted esterase YcpF (UPF0227 family)